MTNKKQTTKEMITYNELLDYLNNQPIYHIKKIYNFYYDVPSEYRTWLNRKCDSYSMISDNLGDILEKILTRITNDYTEAAWIIKDGHFNDYTMYYKLEVKDKECKVIGGNDIYLLMDIQKFAKDIWNVFFNDKKHKKSELYYFREKELLEFAENIKKDIYNIYQI